MVAGAPQRARSRVTCLGLLMLACGQTSPEVSKETAVQEWQGSCRYDGQNYAHDAVLTVNACSCRCSHGSIECGGDCTGSAGQPGLGSAGALSFPGVAGWNGSGASGGVGDPPMMGSAGGGAGSAGAPTVCPKPMPHGVTDFLIDDLEDGDRNIRESDGRSGSWFTYNDETPDSYQVPAANELYAPLFLPEVPGKPRGNYVASTAGHGFLFWGAAQNLTFASGCPYDGSPYAGVRFEARASDLLAVRVQFPTAATSPVSGGGFCQELTPSSCYDAFESSLQFDTEWKEYVVLYKDLHQEGWGTPAPFDPYTLLGLAFLVGKTPGDFAFQVDNVSFVAPLAAP